VLRGGEERRVVLASSIAETSLTVPGVGVVVDGGFRRTPRLDAGTGLTRLETLRISRAAADQRAGRAGRQGPGVAIRLWSAALHRGLAPFDRPAILEAELSGLVLDCAAWGAAVGDLPFADAPPAGAVAAGRALLGVLGALDGSRLTELGRGMVRLGAHPRLAAMMLAAGSGGERALAADLAALLEERDPVRDGGADVGVRLAALRGGGGALVARIRQAAGGYRRRLGVGAGVEAEGDAGALLAAGFADRIAQRRGERGSFRVPGGGGARLDARDPLAREGLLVAAVLEQKASARIVMGARLDGDALPAVIAARVVESVESGFDPASGAVFSRRRRRFGALVLSDRVVEADAGEVAAVLARVVAEKPGLLPWDEAARELQARAAVLRGIEAGVADLGDAALGEDGGAWLAPFLVGMTRLADVARVDLVGALRGRLGWEAAGRLDALLPGFVALPGGRAVVSYEGGEAVARARAQAFYGLDGTPVLAGGRVSLRVALLSPAGRVVAVTGDLAGFWRGGWADVRREMRGRYPRHDWPERPWEKASL
jgi:ATP-dependent helicase HrpB